MAKKKGDHVIMRNSKMFCSHCGAEQAVPYPIEIPVFVAMTKAFSKSHANCLKIWTEPIVDQTKTAAQKAAFWASFGERGMSSECIYGQLSGDYKTFGNPTNHPCDPSDFNRCYKLLQIVPEWKMRLDELKTISPVWNNLIDNWDKLTEMLQQQILTKKANGMYEFMKTLGC